MPTSDNDQQPEDSNEAVTKVVDAFRARRAGEADAPETAPEREIVETEIFKISAGQPLGGGDASSQTRQFPIPTAAKEADADETVADEAAEATEETADAEETVAVDETTVEETTVEETTVEETESGIKHETVVQIDGSGEKAETPARTEAEPADPDVQPDPEIREYAVDLDAVPESQVRDSVAELDADDAAEVQAAEAAIEATETEEDEADAEAEPAEAEDLVAAEEIETEEAETEVIAAAIPDEVASDATPTEKIDLTDPKTAAATAAGAAGAAAAAKKAAATASTTPPAGQDWSTAAHEPEVIPPAADTKGTAGKAGSRKWIYIVAALIVAAVIAALVWWFVNASSPEGKAAAAAETYQEAMVDGDLETLRSITCGEEYAYYSGISQEEFNKAYQSQRERNQMIEVTDITGVSVTGDTAVVGVDIASTSDPSKTSNAQITVHKIGGEWKVCTTP